MTDDKRFAPPHFVKYGEIWKKNKEFGKTKENCWDKRAKSMLKGAKIKTEMVHEGYKFTC
jgi:hypothetical protein